MADAVDQKKNVIDKISSLPDDVLLHIISLLPIDDTARICLLSTRFQKLSRSIPILFCRDDGYSFRIEFTKFMEKALSNHEKLQRVQKFHLRCSNYNFTSATIFKWIDSVVTASASNLQELHIHVKRREAGDIKLPSSVFSCQKLKFLKLVGQIRVDEIPTGMHFPCLKTLELESISIVPKNPWNNSLSTLFSVLEISLVRGCKLKILRENKNYYTYQMNFGYVKGCWVQGDCPKNLDLESINGGTMYKRDPAIKVLKQLELTNHDMLEIVRFMGRDFNPPYFPHLTHLKIKITPTDDQFSALPLFLENSPKLTFLELKILPNNGDDYYIIDWDAPATTVYQCLLQNLETVKIFDPYYEFESEEVVKYFLKKAKVLKKLVLCAKRLLSDEIKANIVDQPRASGQCEVEFVQYNPYD